MMLPGNGRARSESGPTGWPTRKDPGLLPGFLLLPKKRYYYCLTLPNHSLSLHVMHAIR